MNSKQRRIKKRKIYRKVKVRLQEVRVTQLVNDAITELMKNYVEETK